MEELKRFENDLRNSEETRKGKMLVGLQVRLREQVIFSAGRDRSYLK